MLVAAVCLAGCTTAPTRRPAPEVAKRAPAFLCAVGAGGARVAAVGSGTFADLRVVAAPVASGSPVALVRAGHDALVYVSDVGPDRDPLGEGVLARAWESIAPLMRRGEVRAILVECSSPGVPPFPRASGRTTPFVLEGHLARLAWHVNGQLPFVALRGVPVVVLHPRPALGPGDEVHAVLEALRGSLRLWTGARIVVPCEDELLEL